MSAAPEANGLAAKLGQNGASAIEAMERMNADASALHIWLRTQANAPAQKAWFKETALDTAGQKAQGRVGGAQMKAVPHHWRWAEIFPYLERISRLAAESSISPIAFVDRQQFLLTNPALGGRLQVANTLRCAVSIYNQGDCAPVHMHSPNASRTILSSNGGYTIVEGERCEAGRGDLILTPHGTWHDHGNDQPQPVMWMDVLDWPLLEFLDCIWLDDGFTGEKAANGRTQATRFADGHSQALYGSGGMMPTFAPAVPGIGRQTSPLIHYRCPVCAAMMATRMRALRCASPIRSRVLPCSRRWTTARSCCARASRPCSSARRPACFTSCWKAKAKRKLPAAPSDGRRTTSSSCRTSCGGATAT